MQRLSVLLTNSTLGLRAGSEMYVRDVALALLRRGHRPVAFSLVTGLVAEELRKATVPVIDGLERLGEAPDVIHGHHHLETLIAALAFPTTPIVHFCHGWVPWEEKPLHHPSIHRYVAVDETCMDRLVREEGIAADRVELLLNFVDLDRFRPRAPLPSRPERALVLSNQAAVDGYTRAIAAACQATGVALDIVGARRGNPTDAPERLLPDYDLIFAKGRAALESLAVGCAVVLCDEIGCGPLVTPANVDRLRSSNFGVRELQHAHDCGWYVEQISAYSAHAAAEIRDRIRSEAGMDAAVDRLIGLYVAASARKIGSEDGSRAAALHLQRISAPLKEAHGLVGQIHRLSRDLSLARQELNSLAEERASLCEALKTAESSIRELDEDRSRERESSIGELDEALRRERERYEALATLRLRNAVLRMPVAGPVLQTTARSLARFLSRFRQQA